MKHQKTLLILGILIALAAPAVSAWSPGQPWENNPENIAAMQAYVAYAGEQYKARMDGAVEHIIFTGRVFKHRHVLFYRIWVNKEVRGLHERELVILDKPAGRVFQDIPRGHMVAV